MEQIDGSETPACKNQTPGIHPKDYSQEYCNLKKHDRRGRIRRVKTKEREKKKWKMTGVTSAAMSLNDK
jgi:hypothetical protein